MNVRAPRIAGGLAAVVVLCAFPVLASSPERLSGSISGWVTNSLGTPQMGAAVLLFGKAEKMVSRALTDETGSFIFDSLRPGEYSIRVTLSSFLPALRRNIVVQPGVRSLLNVNLAGVLSSVEIFYSTTGGRAVMSDEWKWALRSASATRPVLRLRPAIDISAPAERRGSTSAFSDTRGVVKVSAGDHGAASQLGYESDLGTAFALATSVFGSNSVQVSGNVGYSTASGIPSAGFSTRYSRAVADGSSPEVKLTMRQMFLPARVGSAFVAGQRDGTPALRTMSAEFSDRARVGEKLEVEYGFSLESVTFLDRLNYFSPYGRATYNEDENNSFEFGFSSGMPPTGLFTTGREPGRELQRDLSQLALFPRVSLRDGRVRVQRTENFELAYRKTAGSRAFSVAGYRESLVNAAVTMIAPGGIPERDVLPDLMSDSSVFNIGDYAGFGYMATVSQALGEKLSAALAYGGGNALVPARSDLGTTGPEEVRSIMRRGRRHWVTARISGSTPGTRTQFVASYRWADGRTLNAGHYYITQNLRPENGLNVFLRQQLPAFCGRLEATADLRNLLAEGYVPLTTPDGRRIILMHTPRSVRGGLAFIF